MVQSRFLYTVFIPDRDQQKTQTKQSKRVSKKPSLTSDSGDVQETGSSPGARPVNGVLKGEYAKLISKQLEELAVNGNYDSVAYFTDDNDPLNDAYVTVEQFSVNPIDPKTPLLWEYDGRISEAGTRQSHFRAVETQVVPIDNPFSDGSDPRVAIPTSANAVRWYDDVSQQIENVAGFSSGQTAQGRNQEIIRYNPTNASFDDPTLLYRDSYEVEGGHDARVWDDFGRAQFDENGVNSWQKVFSTGHNFNGVARVENGLVRLNLEPFSLDVEQWDSVNEQYDAVSLGVSDWALDTFNFTRISPGRVEGQLGLRDVISDQLYNINFQVNRSTQNILFTVPPNAGSPPQGVIDLLDPVAETWSQAPQNIVTIKAKSEVND